MYKTLQGTKKIMLHNAIDQKVDYMQSPFITLCCKDNRGFGAINQEMAKRMPFPFYLQNLRVHLVIKFINFFCDNVLHHIFSLNIPLSHEVFFCNLNTNVLDICT